MKILTSKQIREADAYTIAHEPIASIDLMERASASFVKWFVDHFHKQKAIKIFCGLGNNGGDGLAVGRMLLEKNYKVEVFAIRHSDVTSEDFTVNEQRLSNLTGIKNIYPGKNLPSISKNNVVIDAVFGSGLTRPVKGLCGEVIQHINKSKCTVVAIDIASGLYCDELNNDKNIVHATHTVSFQNPKLSLLLPQNEVYTGDWHLVPIGLDEGFIESMDTNNYYIDRYLVKKIVKRRAKFSHKGTFGHALLITGSYGKMGAALLAAKACLRSGAGLLTMHIPKCGYEIVQTALPEAMVTVDDSNDYFTTIPEIEKYSAIGIGPGLGMDKLTQKALSQLIQKSSKPLVIDADAINIIGKNKDIFRQIPANSIFTPHPKEFERVARIVNPSRPANDYERLDLLRTFAAKTKSFIVLKGAHTCIATPDCDCYFNSTGNPGMATAGSGDVLTGIITGLLAQGYSPFEAAILGIYLHGLAGDIAAKKFGKEAMIASDMVKMLGNAYKEIYF
ncbi:MAG: NAD(P)H-hydrate dehydratase [Cytophagales bacterium]|nr:NAD(P)H-hydrate dehydratase [Cytophagales bacterium]